MELLKTLACSLQKLGTAKILEEEHSFGFPKIDIYKRFIFTKN